MSATRFNKPTYPWWTLTEQMIESFMKDIPIVDGKPDITTEQLRNLIAEVWITGKED